MATSRRTTSSKSRSIGRGGSRKAPPPKPELPADGNFSPRQQAVLTAALDLLVEAATG